MPRLSIVIPCLGGAADFDGTLVSVLQHRPADCQVLVAHRDPYGDPYGLEGEVEFLAAGDRSLTGLINAGLGQVRGEIVHILGCGLEATEGWTDAAVAHFDDDDVSAVSPLVLEADRQTIISAGVRFTRGGRRSVACDRRLLSPGAGRLRARVLGPTLVAGFYRRQTLAACGGFDAAVGDALADADLALAIQSLGQLHVCEPASQLVQMADPWAAINTGGFTSGRGAERVFWRHAAARGLAFSLACHGPAVAAELITSGWRLATLANLLGRAAATAELGSAARYQQRLLDARQRLDELAKLRATIRLPIQAAPAAVPQRRRAA